MADVVVTIEQAYLMISAAVTALIVGAERSVIRLTQLEYPIRFAVRHEQHALRV